MIRELSILRQLTENVKNGDYKHSINLYDARLYTDYEGSMALAIIMEYTGRSLDKLMEKSNIMGRYKDIKQIAYNLLCSLKYLHGMGIMHRDVKPANILIAKECRVHICDFGISRTVNPRSLRFKPEESSRNDIT